jgi:hypothetical protein
LTGQKDKGEAAAVGNRFASQSDLQKEVFNYDVEFSPTKNYGASPP